MISAVCFDFSGALQANRAGPNWPNPSSPFLLMLTGNTKAPYHVWENADPLLVKAKKVVMSVKIVLGKFKFVYGIRNFLCFYFSAL